MLPADNRPASTGPGAVTPSATLSVTLSATLPHAQTGVSATPTPTPNFPTVLSSTAATATFSPTGTATFSPTPTAFFTPVPAAELPQAPGKPSGVFVILTRTGEAPETAVHLEWYPAEAGDYMIRGYHAYRCLSGTGSYELRSLTSSGESLTLDFDDPAALDGAYEYYVTAVDSKGREGAHSPDTVVDLSHLPPEELDPPAPLGLTATSRRDDVKLAWRRVDPWISPWSAYRVYRATTVAGLKRGLLVSLTFSAMEVLPARPTPTPTAVVVPQTAGFFGSRVAQGESTSGLAGGSWFGAAAQTTVGPQAQTATAWPFGGAAGGLSGSAGALSTSAGALTGTALALSVSAQALAAVQALAQKAVDEDNQTYFYLYDTPTAQKVDYYYAVTSLDRDGRESPLSLTVVARATGPLPPTQPRALTATSKTEQVLLNWQASEPGTAVLSGYVLTRRELGTERWSKVAMLGVSSTTYSDSPDAGQYVYRLAAFDAVGNTGEAAYVGASPTAKIVNNTLIITMPSAYADNPGRDTGLNLNVLFDFYVGSLFASYSNTSNQATSSIFQQLEIGTMSEDLKYAFLNDQGWVPGFATGLYTTELIGFGGGNAGSVGVSSSGGGLATLGDVYAVLSKRFVPSNPGAVFHIGLMHGNLANDLTQAPVPNWAWPTIYHLMPSGSYPFLYSRFVPNGAEAVAESPNLAYFGLQFPFSLKFGSYVWRSGLRLEAMIPLAWEAQAAPSAIVGSGLGTASAGAPTTSGIGSLPYLINIHVDNLPLFGFEFGVFEFAGGYEVIAFYHIPDLTWAWW